MKTPTKKIDILAVDDREDGLISIEAVLDDPNYRVITAKSGAEALALLPHHEFSLILMDVQMPIMDGFQTAHLIKNDPRHRDIPIIFITATNKDERFIFKGYESGAVDYLLKPFDPQVLKAKVAIFSDFHFKAKSAHERARVIQDREQQESRRVLAAHEFESIARYQALADAIPHIVLKTRVDGSLEYSNRKWPEYSGLDASLSSGTGWQAAFHPNDLQQLMKKWFEAVSNSVSFEHEVRIQHFDGSYRWHFFRAVPECNRNEVVTGWIATCTDIHSARLASDELSSAKIAAEEANKAKTHFVANMSHEMRTPLSAILGFAEVIRLSVPNDKELMENILPIQRNGELLLKIVDEVLDLAKVESGQLGVDPADLDLKSLLSDILDLMRLKVMERPVMLEFKILSTLPQTIYSDPTRLRQILLNVIGNAIKFTPRGFVKVEITYANKTLRFNVTDTGIGISKEDVRRLFQPFMQGDYSNSRKFGGSGLGLSLSKRLAQALGGNVKLEHSEISKGSTFIIEIEAPARGEKKFQSLSDEAPPNEQENKETALPRLDDTFILLAEDMPENQYLITHFLKKAGARVEIANNGVEAVTRAQNGQHAVILMDIQMPMMDGYEATRKLRDSGYAKPIIALTARALTEEKKQSLKFGFNDHLSKPIDFRALIKVISSYTGNSAFH